MSPLEVPLRGWGSLLSTHEDLRCSAAEPHGGQRYWERSREQTPEPEPGSIPVPNRGEVWSLSCLPHGSVQGDDMCQVVRSNVGYVG